MRPTHLGIALLFALTATSASSQVLWGNTQYGMSPKEVLRTVPNTIPVPPGQQDETGLGLIELIRLPREVIALEAFRVGFFFKGDKLQQVLLTQLKNTNPSFTQASYDRLQEALRAKYGQEVHRQSGQISQSVSWMLGKTNITLSIFEGDKPWGRITLVYQTRVSQDGEKL